MAIKSGQTAGVQDLAASTTDKVVHNVSNRTVVTAFSVFNDSGANAQISVFDSPDGTSAAGKEVAQYTIADQESVDIIECIGQGYVADRRIIVVVNTSGVIAGDLHTKLTYTLFTGDS